MNVGKIVSHYRILEKLGQGGLGEVFLAEDTILNRHVALKFLTSMEGPIARKQILDEARSAASIDHPNTCKVFEVGEVDGRSFIAMEYLPGDTLAERMRAGRIPVAEAIRIATEISEALADAHEKSIVHCDLKPANVMIIKDGHVKLMDFGLARRAPRKSTDDPTEVLSSDRPILGTPAYMPPEQIRGQNLDPRTDVFALGILLFEMVSGVNPFRRDSPQACLDAVLHDDVPMVEQLTSDIPPGLSAILQRALAKRPSERFPSAREVWLELNGIRLGNAGHTIRMDATAPISEPAPAPPPAPAKTAIAILPLTDFSPERDQEYFCQGLAEELITALGRVPQLRVASRTAAFRYGKADLDLAEIGRALKVSVVLEGSVQKSGDRVRIAVKLVDTENGFQIWSERFDRKLDDIFELQDEISRAVVNKLQVTFAPSVQLVRKGPQSLAAYESYLKGRFFWNKRTEDGLRRSIDQFEQALAEEPEYALAYSGLADAYLTLGLQGAAPPREVMPNAKEAVDWALRLNPSLPEALTSRGCLRAVFDWDWKGAAQDFKDAIAADPRYARARQWYAMNCLAPLGQFEAARKELQLAAELEPVSQVITTSLGALEFLAGDYELAAATLRSVLDLDRSFYLAHYFLGQTLVEKQMFEEAIVELQFAAELAANSAESVAALAYAQARAGQFSKAAAALTLLEKKRVEQYVSPVLLAQVRIGIGDEAMAIKSLQEGLELRSTDLIWLGVRPVFQSIRSQPAVVELLNRIGLRSGTTSLKG